MCVGGCSKLTLASLSNRPPVTLTCSTLGFRSIAAPNIFFKLAKAKFKFTVFCVVGLGVHWGDRETSKRSGGEREKWEFN